MLLQFLRHAGEVGPFVLGEGVPVAVYASAGDAEALSNVPQTETGSTGQLDLIAQRVRGDSALPTWLLKGVVLHAQELHRMTGSGRPARPEAPMACRWNGSCR